MKSWLYTVDTKASTPAENCRTRSTATVKAVCFLYVVAKISFSKNEGLFIGGRQENAILQQISTACISQDAARVTNSTGSRGGERFGLIKG